MAPLCVWPILQSPGNQLELLRRLRHRSRANPNPRSKSRVSPRQYRDYFKFTIVRDPWSRALSLYRNVMKDETHRQKHGVCKDATFRDFLSKNIGKGMLRSQLDWIVDWRGNIPLDFIGRFDNLHEDFPKLAARLGRASLSFDPAVHKPDLTRWFDDELDHLIRKTYHKEIELFRFLGPRPEARYPALAPARATNEP